jgi:hypothetical protein
LAPDGVPGVVDEDVDVTGLVDQALNIDRVADLGGNEPRFSARHFDRIDGLGTALRIAAVDDDLGSLTCQLNSDRTADAGRCARDERSLAVELLDLSGSHDCS